MRLTAALEGNLTRMMDQEIADATHGIQTGVQQATDLLKNRLRRQVNRAGLGRRLSKTWQGKYFPNKGMDAAGLVFSKAPQIVEAHSEGTLIRAQQGRFLAIFTGAISKRLFFRRKPSPANWPARLGQLVFLPTPRGGVLVVKNYGLTKTGKQKKRGGSKDTVMFVLVPQIRLRKRLDPAPEIHRVETLLPALIQRHYRTTPTESTHAR